jgi:phosphate:Na+ symporter
MPTTISILGGVGLFLLGMTVMTDGLKALAGSALRTVLAKAAATPMRGAFWGAIATLLVQSSSATTMTTIGLVSAGLLTFRKGSGLFWANVGTSHRLLVAIGVRVSLTAAALPMIFVGALVKLLGRGLCQLRARRSLVGLVLFGLTTLQRDGGWPNGCTRRFACGSGAPGAGGSRACSGSHFGGRRPRNDSRHAIFDRSHRHNHSAHYAGAVGLDQACALIIGQNIGTATSSAMAAIGASTTANRWLSPTSSSS